MSEVTKQAVEQRQADAVINTILQELAGQSSNGFMGGELA